ncbi:hypothetical protein L1285_02000 [Pseudoalteromonas sp. DL2-H2.2]|uniref:alpha/beta hydrolase n=1 Tax=Pseudoalteromonas sp. DL2-H2.2 TaxID=2908889 RepID=UPI001EEAC86A|nr:alpha/beta hydrolase-fold protein [Pseudoalteromonas sp. DL2-H2.2]MCF2907117.1 hypothetical protein [Pseudoalteromonas sp. DL2-H2.2]
MKLPYYLMSILLFVSHLVAAESYQLNSKYLQSPQTYEVFLPDNYEHEQVSYPVIYLLHGQWDGALLNATLSTLQNKLPEFIVVSVHARGKKLQQTKGNTIAAQFWDYFYLELMAQITRQYRVAPYAMLAGHSNAGSFVLRQFLTNNKHFKHYIALSPSLDDGELLALAKKQSEQVYQGKLFISVANEGEHMEQPFDQLVALLTAQNQLSLVNRKYPDYDHQASKIIGLVDALNSGFQDWVPSATVKKAGFKPYQAHYAQLKEEYGFDVKPAKDDVLRLIAYFAIEANVAELAQFVDFFVQQYPDGKNALLAFRQQLSEAGYMKAAQRIPLNGPL